MIRDLISSLVRVGIRRGILLATPYLFQIGIGSAIVGGGGVAWLVGLTDWKTAGLLVVALVLCGLLFSTESKWGRLGIVLVIGVTLYLKGLIDGGLNADDEMERLKDDHRVAILDIQTRYAKATKAEQVRQEAIAAETKRNADEAKAVFDSERDRLRAELARIREKSKNAPDADYPVYNADDIADLNRLRYDPRRDAGPRASPVRGGKAKNPRNSKVDAPAVPPAARAPRRQSDEGCSQSSFVLGCQALRGLQGQTWGSGEARPGAGRSPGWQGF